jgi:hypothetical protein
VLFTLLLTALSLPKAQQTTRAVQTTLIQLRSRFNLARRFLRLFRFLDSFHSSYLLASTVPSAAASVPLETWLDIIGRSLMGMYGLLESATLPDLLEVQGLQIWGSEWTPTLNVEAQRYWFLALACAVLSGLVKVVKVFAYAPVPATGSGYGTGEQEKKGTEEELVKGEGEDKGDVKLEWEKERERLRAVVARRKEERRAWRREVRRRSTGLMRRVVADGLDLLLPGSVIGWVKVDPSMLGLAAFVSTGLTALEVWERCGTVIRSRHGDPA